MTTEGAATSATPQRDTVETVAVTKADGKGKGRVKSSVLPETIHKGLLWKLNPNQRERCLNPLGPWKRRWFALDEERFQMRYYDSAMKLRGTIDLRLVNSVEPLAGTTHGFYAFNIKSGINPRIFTLGHQSETERNFWVDRIRAIVETMPPVNQRLVEQFCRADKDHSFTLEFSEVKELLLEKRVQVTTATMRLKFEEVDADHNESLDFSEFERLDMNLRRDEHATHLFEHWTNKAKYMTAEMLGEFLRGVQREFSTTREICLGIINAHKPDDPAAPAETMDVWGFTEWLCSTYENGPVDKLRSRAVHMDTSRPMSHYFIAGSHHTWLLSEQVKGAASVEAYVAVLQRGARYIEVDVWDGSGGQPVVCHANSMFQKLPFAGVVQKIREHAFSRTQLPLLVAINNHCSASQQDVVAARLREYLGDCLCPLFRTDQLPSPAALANRVILKMTIVNADSAASPRPTHSRMHSGTSQKLKSKKTKASLPSPLAATDAPAASGDPSKTTPSPVIGRKTEAALALVPDVSDESSDDETQAGSGLVSRRSKRITEETSRTLAAMIHLEGIRFPGAVREHDGKRHFNFHGSGSGGVPCWHFFSLSNEKAQQLVDKGYIVAMQQYAAEHLVKVYPRGTNFEYDPSTAWAAGCSIATVNYHAPSAPLMLHEAKFMDNGACGYILKPEWLITGSLPPEDIAVKLMVRVISARQLPQISREVIDPYVSVAICGWGADFQEQRTKAIQNNGWDPKWDAELQFELTAPDVDIVVLRIWDKNTLTEDKLVAQAAVSFPMLRLGIRSIPLYNQKHMVLPGARLLCEFQIEALF